MRMARKTVLAALALAMVASQVHAGEAKAETQYMIAMVGGKKLGYGVNVRELRDGKVVTSQEMVMSLMRGSVALKIRMLEKCVETADGKPLGFTCEQDMGFVRQVIEGRVEGDRLQITTTQGKNEQKQTVDWPKGALMMEGARLRSIAEGLKEGTKYTIKSFSAGMQMAVDTQFEIGAVKDVDLFGRVVPLTEVKTVVSAPSGKIEGVSYVDKNCDALKTVMSVMGMSVEMLACTKEVAMAPGEPADFFDKTLVACPTALGDCGAARSVTYDIRPLSEKAGLKFLEGPSQKVTAGAGGAVTVTVAPAAAGKGAAFPYKGDKAEALAALKPTRFLQCDDAKVKELAKQATTGQKDAAAAAKAIQDFVAEYVKKKDMTVGYATAAEVAAARQGDCTEHAVLAAALCRAAGIPSQVVTGLAYVKSFAGHKDVFVPHAWFRAWVGEQWVDYDAALRRFDAGHIMQLAGDGDPSEFFGSVGTLGQFRIESVKVVRE